MKTTTGIKSGRQHNCSTNAKPGSICTYWPHGDGNGWIMGETGVCRDDPSGNRDYGRDGGFSRMYCEVNR